MCFGGHRGLQTRNFELGKFQTSLTFAAVFVKRANAGAVGND